MFKVQNYQRENFRITTDNTQFDYDVIRDFLANTPPDWAAGISKDLLKRAIENSLCFGVFDGDQQIGLARVITDYTTFAYLTDVFILEAYRGQGLSKWLMDCIHNHPELQGLRRWFLITVDAQGLYEQFDYKIITEPDHYMEIFHPGLYLASASSG